VSRQIPLFFVYLCACSSGIKAAPGTEDREPAGSDEDASEDTATDTGPIEDASDPLSQIDPTTLPAGPEACRDPTYGEVTYVIDGDTIKVMTGRGEERVRLIGIDASEVDHDGNEDECWAEEASDFVREQLEGSSVWLTFDAECEDHFERTLAYVHTRPGEQGFFQRALLLDGWVETFVVSPNTAFSTTFSSDEDQARAAGLGMWDACRR